MIIFRFCYQDEYRFNIIRLVNEWQRFCLLIRRILFNLKESLCRTQCLTTLFLYFTLCEDISILLREIFFQRRMKCVTGQALGWKIIIPRSDWWATISKGNIMVPTGTHFSDENEREVSQAPYQVYVLGNQPCVVIELLNIYQSDFWR